MTSAIVSSATNHLWQSTIFAFAAALLTLAFLNNRAQVRYWLWLAASLKFLVPFAALIRLGTATWDALAVRKLAAVVTPGVSAAAVPTGRCCFISGEPGAGAAAPGD